MTKETRIYNVGKIASSINGAEKTGQTHVKSEIKSFFNSKK